MLKNIMLVLALLAGSSSVLAAVASCCPGPCCEKPCCKM
jgi:hypothetical protein